MGEIGGGGDSGRVRQDSSGRNKIGGVRGRRNNSTMRSQTSLREYTIRNSRIQGLHYPEYDRYILQGWCKLHTVGLASIP